MLRRPRAACRPNAMPAAISGSALSRDRFQPVTVCPAAISRGTINRAHGAETDKSEIHADLSHVMPGLGRSSSTPLSRVRGQLTRRLRIARLKPGMSARASATRHGSLSKPSPKPLRLIGKPMPSSGVWKMMKVADWPVRSLLDQVVVHHDLGDAAVRQAAHEAGAADIGVVDLEPQAGGQQHAERRDHPHQPRLLVGGLAAR